MKNTTSIRSQQISSVLRTALQEILARGLNDPRIRGLVSVTWVEVLPDLSEARVGVSILPADAAPLTLQGLQSATGHMRRKLSDHVQLRRIPRLIFKLDETLKKQAALDEALRAGANSSASRSVPEVSVGSCNSPAIDSEREDTAP